MLLALTGCSGTAESSENGDSAITAATATTAEHWDVKLTAAGHPREVGLDSTADVTMDLRPTATGAEVTTEDLRIHLPAIEFGRTREIVVGNGSPRSEDWTPNFGMEFSYRTLPDGEWVVVEPSRRGAAFTFLHFNPWTCGVPGQGCGDYARSARAAWEGSERHRDELGQLVLDARALGDQLFSLPKEGPVELRILVRPIRWKPGSKTLSTWVGYQSI